LPRSSRVPDSERVFRMPIPHVWTLTSGLVALSGHGVLEDPVRHQVVLDEIRERMANHAIKHVTFQLEPQQLHQISRSGEDRGGLR